LFAVFFPDQCRLCERPLKGFTSAPVCLACLDSLEACDASRCCRRCGESFATAHALDGDGICRVCRLSPPAFDQAASFGLYEGDLRRLIHLLKYGRMLPLAAPLAARLQTVLPRLEPFELIVPVPLHWSRSWRRGFNQSGVLARRLARDCGISCRSGVLRRVRPTPAQAALSDRDRLRNVRGAFRARPAVEGRRILLVDDVMTTGATLNAAAVALKAAGAGYVGALTLARASRHSRVGQPFPSGGR
jgi:ComF family protein